MTGRTPRPRVIACQGGSSGVRLAAEVARELESSGATGPVVDLSTVGAASSTTRSPAVAIDGCASACAARQAAARGVPLVATVNLAELGAHEGQAGPPDRRELVSRVVSRLSRETNPVLPTRPRRHGRQEARHDGRTHAIDDYLLAIDAATSPIVECGALVTDAPTLASHVSDELGVTRASAGEMLRKLEAEGLVQRGTGKHLLLTATGRARADAIVRRQRVLEVFATRFLGYEPAESREPARLLLGAFDDEAITRLDERLGFPERCPHGCPVDARRAREEAQFLRVLSSLAPGERARVAWLWDGDSETLAALFERGIRPDVELVVTDVTAASELAIGVGGNTVVLGDREAGSVLVRPLASPA